MFRKLASMPPAGTLRFELSKTSVPNASLTRFLPMSPSPIVGFFYHYASLLMAAHE